MAVIKRNRWAITLAILVIASFLGLGSVAVRRAQALPNDTYQELETFANVLAIVQKNYVEPVTTKRLIDGAITGMLSSPTRTAPTSRPSCIGTWKWRRAAVSGDSG